MLERVFPRVHPDELHTRAGQRHIRRQHVAVRRMDDRVRSREAVDHELVGRVRRSALFYAQTGGRVGLRVKIAEQDLFARLLQRSRQIDRRRRLSNAALLVHKRQDPPHRPPHTPSRTIL